jgi:hypothetical protein
MNCAIMMQIAPLHMLSQLFSCAKRVAHGINVRYYTDAYTIIHTYNMHDCSPSESEHGSYYRNKSVNDSIKFESNIKLR